MNSPSAFQFRAQFLEKQVSALSPKTPVTVLQKTTVSKAIEIINETKLGGVCVVDEQGKICGIFTERDVIKKVAGTGTALGTLEVGQFMTKNPECLNKTASVARAIYFMAAGGFRHIPIINTDKVPTGILTIKDFVDFLYLRLGKKYTDENTPLSETSMVDNFFSSKISVLEPHKPLTVSEDTTIDKALKVLQKNNVGAILVALSNEHPTGIFTERDYITKLCPFSESIGSIPISTKMTFTPTTIEPETKIATAFSLLSEKGFRHLPVVCPRDKLTGILSVKNFIQYLSASVMKQLK